MSQKGTVFLKRILRQVLIFLLSILIVASTVYFGINTAYSRYIKPVDAGNSSLVDIEIPRGSSLSKISEILYENNLIRNKMVFKLYVDISNKTSRLKAGKYKLSRDMDLDRIMDELLTGNAAIDTIKITIIEGWDIRRIARYLIEEKEYGFSEKEFIDAAKIENFTDFVFLQDIPEERKTGEVGIAPLEGYLFPDTYLVYEDASPEDIMRKMLTQFEKVYNESVMERAQELEMDMDEVVTLASVIQREARITEEFPMISAVFHNRLKKDMPLGADSTIQFLVNEDRWAFSSEELKIDSPYNTYENQGLPIGPISSPGRLALTSALFPYEEFMNSKKPYLYFVLKDPKTGEHVFNTDYNQHMKDKKEYEASWKDIGNQED
ncbi:MAG TPA: endolytic transglycosylase MltG [Clostridia bacterium]|nr:endolytic transglycosylase MltG [Clostridia bacterium]